MWWQFWKASFMVLAGYVVPFLLGVWFAIPVLQIVWVAFCIVRLAQLCRRSAYKKDAPSWDRESFGFALGGTLCSFGICLFLALTPIRVG
jgi:hypothetical protein